METVVVKSGDKDSAYIEMVLLFNQVKQMSAANIGNWSIGECYTSMSEQHFITTYTNGKIWGKAVSIKGEHTYSFGEEKKAEDE